MACEELGRHRVPTVQLQGYAVWVELSLAMHGGELHMTGPGIPLRV